MKKFAFFDIDNTIYDGYITSGFYLFLANQGIKKSFIHKQDKILGQLYRSGQINYSEATKRVIQLQADILKGFTTSQVQKYQQQYMAENNRLFPWVKPLLEHLMKHQFTIYLISAAASPCAQAITQYLNTDKLFSSELEIRNDKYTGKVLNLLNDEAKSQRLHRILGHLSKRSYKIGFGDSTGDIAMLELMNDAFVINPHQPEFFELSKQKGWHLVTNKNILSQVKSLPIFPSSTPKPP